MAAQLKYWMSGMQLIYPNIERLLAHNVVFSWLEDHEREFQGLRKAIQEAVKLSPIDTRKKLYAFVDSKQLYLLDPKLKDLAAMGTYKHGN